MATVYVNHQYTDVVIEPEHSFCLAGRNTTIKINNRKIEPTLMTTKIANVDQYQIPEVIKEYDRIDIEGDVIIIVIDGRIVYYKHDYEQIEKRAFNWGYFFGTAFTLLTSFTVQALFKPRSLRAP